MLIYTASTKHDAKCSGVDTIYIIHSTQYFRGADTIYTIHDAVFSRDTRGDFVAMWDSMLMFVPL